MAKKEQKEYIVDFPNIDFPNIRNLGNLEYVISISKRGAASKTLGRKVTRGNRISESIAIGHAMNQLDQNYGGAANYVYEIPTKIKELSGEDMGKTDEHYRIMQEIWLAEDIGERRKTPEENDERIRKHLDLAKRYIRYYYSNRKA